MLDACGRIIGFRPDSYNFRLLKHELTTEDIKVNVDDLKVLGKKDFKALLKWRSSIREEHKMDAKAEKAAAAIETTELEPVDEDEAIEAELSNLTKEEAARVKRARRKANEKRAKTLQRMQLNMVVPSDIGMEQEGPDGHHSLFGLSKINKAGVSAKEAEYWTRLFHATAY